MISLVRKRQPDAEVQVGISAYITVELIDAKTQVVKQKLRFKNLITDAGLDRIGANVGMNGIVFNTGGTNYCGVGTGSTAPANADTTLVTEVAPASSNRTLDNGGIANAYAYVSGPPDYHSGVRTFLFLEAQGNGNLTEIGIFSAVTGGSMWMRQLLKDGGGTPTTVVKTSSDQLRVTYELRVQPLQSDVSISRTISAVSYNITIRARNASAVGTWGSDLNGGALESFGLFGTNAQMCMALETTTLGARTAEPSGSQVSATSIAWAAYGGATYYRDMTAIFDPGIANFAGGIGSIVFYETGNGDQLFQASFSPAFTKDATKRLTLVIRISWTRV